MTELEPDEPDGDLTEDDTLSSLPQSLRLSLEQNVCSQKSSGSEYGPISQSSFESTNISLEGDIGDESGIKRTTTQSLLEVSPVKGKN